VLVSRAVNQRVLLVRTVQRISNSSVQEGFHKGRSSPLAHKPFPRNKKHADQAAEAGTAGFGGKAQGMGRKPFKLIQI
jgi:hypothetical protein